MPHQLFAIDVANSTGLEIGPLAAPIVRKTDGRVFYVDHIDTAELRAKYSKDVGMRDRLDEIVDVDFVVGPDATLTEAVAAEAPYDYVIASHVLEHIPDMVAWIEELAGLLRVGGILSLTVPDKRYTFDINRRLTEPADVVDGYLARRVRPTYAQAFDFYANALCDEVDTGAVWAGTADYTNRRRGDCADPDIHAYKFCRDEMDAKDYVDIHCHVFDPQSFCNILDTLMRIGLFSFEVAGAFPTEVGNFEFYVTLRKVDTDAVQTLPRQLASVARARVALAAEPTVPSQSSLEVSTPHLSIEVSPRELRWLTRKRMILFRTRRARSALLGRRNTP